MIAQQDLDHIKSLIASGCDVNFIGEDGVTPLMMAVMSGKLHLVQLLVENGADVNQMDVDGNSPLIYASFESRWDIFDYLAPLTSPDLRGFYLLSSASDGEYEVVNRIISTGLNVDFYRQKGVWKENGITALIAAIENEYFDIVKILLESGANPNLFEEDTGKTPLMYAVLCQNVDIVNLLIKADVNIDTKDLTGETALTKATKIGNVGIAQLLLKADAEINLYNKNIESDL